MSTSEDSYQIKKNLRAQSAIEYLSTYSWAFVTVAIVFAAFYLVFSSPSNITPPTCTFSSGTSCTDFLLTSSGTTAKIAFLLVNTQSYPIINPTLKVNTTQFGKIQIGCQPTYVLPGGAIFCNQTIIGAKPVPVSTPIAGKVTLNSIACASGNPTTCANYPSQNYPGTFQTHITTPFSSVAFSLIIKTNATLSSGNVYNALLSQNYRLVAQLSLFGHVLPGATTNFTPVSNSLYIKFPIGNIIDTDSNGNATIAFKGNTTSSSGVIPVNMVISFSNVITNSIIIDFQPTGVSIPYVYTTISMPAAALAGIVMSPDGQHSYVPSFSSGNVYVISTLTNTVTNSIGVGGEPWSEAFVGNSLYVADSGGNPGSCISGGCHVFSVINTVNNMVGNTISYPNSDYSGGNWIQTLPSGVLVYATNSAAVDVINPATNTIVNVISGVCSSGCNGEVVSPNSANVYLTDSNANTLKDIAVATNTVVATIAMPPGAQPQGMAISPGGGYLYIAAANGNVLVYNTATNVQVASIPVTDSYGSASPYGLVISSDGNYVYVVDYFGFVIFVSTASNTQVSYLSVPGYNPQFATITPNNQYLYISEYPGCGRCGVEVVNTGQYT